MININNMKGKTQHILGLIALAILAIAFISFIRGIYTEKEMDVFLIHFEGTKLKFMKTLSFCNGDWKCFTEEMRIMFFSFRSILIWVFLLIWGYMTLYNIKELRKSSNSKN